MIHTGKCPKCEKMVPYVNLQAVDVKQGFSANKWLGVSYQCPFCQTILGVGIDPVALNSDFKKELIAILRQLK